MNVRLHRNEERQRNERKSLLLHLEWKAPEGQLWLRRFNRWLQVHVQVFLGLVVNPEYLSMTLTWVRQCLC